MANHTELVAVRGTKRTCLACSARFYDLARDRIVCPSCGADFDATVPADAAPGVFERIAVKPGWRRPGPAARSAPVITRDDAAVSESAEETERDETADEAILETEDADDTEVADLVDAPDEVDKE
jgi:hypothetical protein